jgi:hypothetical protein
MVESYVVTAVETAGVKLPMSYLLFLFIFLAKNLVQGGSCVLLNRTHEIKQV